MITAIIIWNININNNKQWKLYNNNNIFNYEMIIQYLHNQCNEIINFIYKYPSYNIGVA